jgi:hypothetical protein
MSNTVKTRATVADDGRRTIPVEILGEEYQLRTAFKRLKFLRLITSDPAAALAMVFADGEYERLEEVDMDPGELEQVVEAVSSRLVGGPKG